MDKPDTEGSSSPKAPSQQRSLHLMVRGFLVWTFVYMTLQGPEGFFARTADLVDVNWVKLSFLNVPVHLVLTFVVAVCAGSARPGVLRLGLWLGGVNVVLIAGHVVLSIVTAG